MDEAYAHVQNEEKADGNKEAPDGGWGYVVCIGVGLTFMLGFGSSSGFGILFNNFFLEQGGAEGLTWVIGVYNGALSIAGFCSGIALRKYSFRQVGLVGAALFILGDILTIFVTKTYQLVFSFGLIRGAGFGAMIPVSFTAFNCYFTKKRIAMMSANQTMSSMASITFPIFITFLLAEYGFKGTLLLIMAIDLHILIAMLVMHPIEWHLVDRKVQAEVHNINCNIESQEKQQSCSEEMVRMIPPKVQICEKSKTNTECGGSFRKKLTKKIRDNIDFDLLKEPRFVFTLVGLGFAFVSDVTYLAMEPMLLFSYGYSQMEVATCVMVGAIADLISRFLLAVFTYFFAVDSRKIFFVGTCITVFLRIALVSYSEIWYVFLVTAISGLVRCSVQVLLPLVLASAAPDRFPAALALHILFSGVLMLIADPLIGIIYEVTGSYVYCFIAMSLCCIVCVVLWTYDYLVYKENS